MHWKYVSFFEPCLVSLPKFDVFTSLLQNIEVTASTSHAFDKEDEGWMVLADKSGNIHVAHAIVSELLPTFPTDTTSDDPHWSFQVTSFPAMDNGSPITALAVLPETIPFSHLTKPSLKNGKLQLRQYFIVVATTKDDNLPLLRVFLYRPWASFMSQSQELPLSFFKDIPVSFSPNRRLPFVSSTTAPTTPLGYIDHLASSVTSHLCVGFSSGAIALYQGDFLKDKSSPKITFLRDFGARIISLHFHQALFVTTENDILYLPKEQLLPSSTQPLSLVNLDELHGGTHAVASPQVDEVVVVRNTDVHVYNVHGTSYHFSFTSPIQSIHRYFEYLVIITRDPLLLRDTLEIYYLPESLCVYQAHYSHIQYLLPFLRSGLFLYTSETLIRLREKPLKERLQALLTHHLYTVAIRLSSDDPDLHGKYGDYLIQQNNEASALTHYYHTIGHWDSTKVLRKLREPNHLIQFLQWIHEKGEAHQDHTQLLFQCLIQEKKYPDLQTLIHQTNLSFDVQAAIQCCSDHELYALALQLAEKHHQWDLHFELLLKTNSIDDAIVFLNAQPTDQTNELLLRFGRSFLLASPERVTEFLITHVSKTHPDHLTSLVKLYLPHMPQRFLFLKFLLLEYDGRHEINSDVGLWNAFLESAHTLDEALLVLQCPDAQYSFDQALLLCKAHNWIEGLLYVYRKLNSPMELMEVYQQIGDIDNMLLICQEYHEGKDPLLWRFLLQSLVQSYPRFENNLQLALQQMEQNNVLSMVEILQLLGQPEYQLPFSVIKSILQKKMERDSQLIEENDKLTMSYRQETKHIQEELLACETGPITLQMTICSACGEKLSLPTVHFICKHSYHARCLNENSKHCLQCYKEHRKLVSIQNALKSQAQEDFFEKLHHSEDGFSVVADWFSKKEIQ